MSIYVTSGRFAPSLAFPTAAIAQMHQLEHLVRKSLPQNSGQLSFRWSLSKCSYVKLYMCSGPFWWNILDDDGNSLKCRASQESTSSKFSSNLRHRTADGFYQNVNTDQHHFWALLFYETMCGLAFLWALLAPVTQRFCFTQFTCTTPVIEGHIEKLPLQHCLSWKMLSELLCKIKSECMPSHCWSQAITSESCWTSWAVWYLHNFHLGYEDIIVAFKIIWTLPFSWMVADADSVCFKCLWMLYKGQRNFKSKHNCDVYLKVEN